MGLPNIIQNHNNDINTIKSTYLPLSGGTMTKTINSTLVTSTYLKGNQGISLINSNVSAGAYTTLWRYPSTNGVFTISGHQGQIQLFYTDNAKIAAGTNGVTKTVTLLNESGNSSFPGTITGLCTKATGDASGNTITTSYASSLALSSNTLTLKSKSGATLSTVKLATTWTSGNNWYRKYADGWIEQGGYIARQVTVTTNFNIAFTSTPTVICGCVYNRASTFYAREVYPNTVSKTAFTITNSIPAGATSDYIKWYACGY